jgi:ABC-type transport system substrate-binding protein
VDRVEGRVTYEFVLRKGVRFHNGDSLTAEDVKFSFDRYKEMDPKRREALLHRIQQLMHERAMFAPIVEQAGLIGVGPRLAEVPSITGHPFISPYEDLRLKGASP